MISTWRITQRRFLSSAFTGEGAALFGGRWNNPGEYVTYTSDTMALATLETLVHLEHDHDFKDFILIPCSIHPDLITTFDPTTLPHGWTRNQAVSRQVGHDFLSSAKTPVLRVPTSVVPQGWNFLLNPAHRRFADIAIGHPVPFDFDPRLK
jgi:RES domain-containing protein